MRSFQELKDRVTSALVLALPDGMDWLVVCFDASRVGLEYWLMQNSKVIAQTSRHLQVHENN